jgi:hypothetical protein
MNKTEKIIKSFSFQDSLNPKVWNNPKSIDSASIKDKVRSGLLNIADNFIEFLDVEIFIDDIVLTGSLANYNWSNFSDFDLHILIDFNQFGKEEDLYKELFDLKKQLYNDKHNITVVGFEVELYAQDSKEEHYSTGVFSILKNEWLIKPNKIDFKLDKEALREKINSWTEKIDIALKLANEENDLSFIDKIKDKVKKYRQIGLKKEGETSYENLVFKYLRRSGYMEKLFKTKNKISDKKLSIERKIEN